MEYKSTYDSPLLRGQDDNTTPRPWNLYQLIMSQATSGSILVDAGCGTAFKTINVAPAFASTIGLDPSSSMIAAAKDNIRKSQIKNLNLLKAKVESLPFKNNSIDVISCMLSRWDLQEIHRVLKPGGKLIIEHIGCEDKRDFKLFFGKIHDRYRGQLLNNQRDTFLTSHQIAFERHFVNVSISNGFWNTYYSLAGLQLLLQNTPTIEAYDESADKAALMRAVSHLQTPSGIKLQQNRILIYAEKAV